MQKILVDSGPLIAFFDKRDTYNKSIIDFLEDTTFRLVTTSPVVTEVCQVLSFSAEAQTDFLSLIQKNAIHVYEFDDTELERLIHLIKKHDEIPMDLADASLIIASEKLNIDKIISIDSEANAYRKVRDNYMENIFKN